MESVATDDMASLPTSSAASHTTTLSRTTPPPRNTSRSSECPDAKRQKRENHEESGSQVTCLSNVQTRISRVDLRLNEPVTDLFAFFKHLLHHVHFDQLFSDPGVVLALFHGLSDAERLIVLRLMELPEAVRWEPFIIWHRGDRKATLRALNNLRSLHIIFLRQHHTPTTGLKHLDGNKTTCSASTLSSPASSSAATHTTRDAGTVYSSTSKPDTGGSVAGSTRSHATGRLSVADVRYQLHPVFKSTLQYSLRRGTAAIPVTQSKAPKHFPTRGTLHTHAARQWRHVMEWLVRGEAQRASRSSDHDTNRTRPSITHPPDLLAIFDRLKLSRATASSTPGQRPPAIDAPFVPLRPSDADFQRSHLTNETFQWLLSDRREQLSSLCVDYVRAVHYGLFVCPEPAAADTGTLEAVCHRRPSDTNGSSSGSLQHVRKQPATMAAAVSSDVLPLHSNEVISRQTLEVLTLLFTLSEVLIGQPCSITILTPAQRRFIQLAYSIGLVWMHKPAGSKHFFPTPLAKLLQPPTPWLAHILSTVSHLTASFGSPLGLTGDGDDEGFRSAGALSYVSALSIPAELYHPAYSEFFARDQQNAHNTVAHVSEAQRMTADTSQHPLRVLPTEFGVIVESNFKVYAYTAPSASLLLTVVARLCELRVLTPSMVVGVLSRDSVVEAYKAGVTADQIIRFFTTHAHPAIYSKSQREGKPLLPENIVAQLRIWEDERRRVRMQRACLFEFSKEVDLDIFPVAVSRAEVGWLLMNTEVPASSNPSSKAYQVWKNKLLEKRKTQPTRPGENTYGWAPVLAIHAQYKEELTHFIRTAMRNATKRP